jgi:hypothetical protein
MEPGAVLWVDLLLPAGDPLWRDDVVGAAGWVGELWAGCVAPLVGPGLPPPTVHHGGLVRTPWSPLVCFAGLGAGEVTLGPAGPKLVGVSQRRTRHAARFQCAVLLEWQPARLLAMTRLTPAERTAAVADVSPRAIGMAAVTGRPAGSLVGPLVEALRTHLP